MARQTTLEPERYRDLVRRALAEDIGHGDLTTDAIVAPGDRGRGEFMAKAPCTLAGLGVAIEAFTQLDPGAVASMRYRDGDTCEAGAVIGEVTARARALLSAERTALNFLQHLSGIATVARRYVDAAAGKITVLDTRKTIPGFRVLAKYAVAVGGATNHRMSLEDGVLIKDNHISRGGGIAQAVARVRATGAKMPIEVEVETLDQVDEALEAGADILLLDNMTIDGIRESVRRSRGRARTEISGGVTLERIPELAATGADYISIGALTHSAPAIDISFEIYPA